jgi:hypothetical protein
MNEEKRKRIIEAAIISHRATERYNNFGMMAVPNDPKDKEAQSVEYALAAAEHFEARTKLDNEILSEL